MGLRRIAEAGDTQPSRPGPSLISATGVGRRRVAWLIGGLAGCWAIVLAGRPAISRVAGLYPDVLPAQPYLVPEHALLLYIVAPLVLLAAIVALLGPGVLAALILGSKAGATETILRGFGIAFGIRLVIHAAGVLAGLTWSTGSFVIADLGIVALLSGLLFVRAGRHGFEWPFAENGSLRRLLVAAALPAVIVIGTIPLLFWQDLNGDGLEMLFVGSSLASHVVPRFPSASGLGGLGGGMMSPGYPIHWFIMLFGSIDGAARLTALLLVPVLFLAMVSLIECESSRRLRPGGEVAVALAVLTFFAVIGLNGRYSPYSADIGSPGTIDIFLLISLCGVVLYLWRAEFLLFAWFALLAFFARPTGLMMIALLGAAGLAAGGPLRKHAIRWSAAGLALWLAALIVYEHIWAPAASASGATGFPAASTLARYRFLQLDELIRFAYWAVPAGIVPAFALLALRRQDAHARLIAVACLGYFVAFYLPAFVALHHFAPLMVLPVVVFWRMAAGWKSRVWTALAITGAAVGLASALPRSTTVYRAAREIGRATEHRVGNLYGSPAERREALASVEVMARIYPAGAGVADPFTRRVHEPIATLHYATVLPPSAERRYIVQYADSTPSFDCVPIAHSGPIQVLVRDTATWIEDRATIPAIAKLPSLYTIPREVLFRPLGAPAGRWDIDLGSKRFLWRIFK